MTIVHVVSSVSRESSGPSYSVVRLCESMIAAGADVELATLDAGPRRPAPAFLRQFPRGCGPRRLGRSPALRRWLDAQVRVRRAGVVHAHGLWQMNVVYPAWAVRTGRAKLIVSPRGGLSRWAMRYGSAVKPLFWRALQRPALRQAACLHATAEHEYEDMRRLGFRQPVAVIPNGVDLSPLSDLSAEPSRKGDDRTLLFLGRLHPVKGVDTLIDAWRLVQDRFPAWRLVVAGDDVDAGGKSGYMDALRRRVMARGAARVSFTGELLGRAKWDAYRTAEQYVLPTRSENFGMTVAEALAAGTPVITTRATPWRAIETKGAGWCIDTGTAPLAACLDEALACEPAALRRMGRRGSDWMAAEFSWRDLAERMARTYDWLLDPRAARPEWVRVD